MKSSLTPKTLNPIRASLRTANKKFLTQYPGLSSHRQPVHTLYGGAHLFSSQMAPKMNEGALRSLQDYAPDAATLARALGQTGQEALWKMVYERIVKKLRAESVEDFRIDFEDGYGNRPDAEEDGHAASTALEVVKGMAEKTLPPFIGIRVKTLSEECAPRSIRTLDVFMTTLLTATKGKLPENFVVTLPKIVHVGQCVAFHRALTAIEKKMRLKPGTIRVEIMVETPQSILGPEGASPLRAFVNAFAGRCRGAHFGTYDYTALCNITAAHQTMINPVCDFAKHVMQVSLAGTEVMLSDGATNVMPVGPHKPIEGRPISRSQMDENTAVVHRAWRLAYSHIRHSLETGYYQGWDLHPAQLPIRYAAIYCFFLEGMESAAARLRAFMDKAAKATLLGDVFDDAATGQGLLNYFLRGMSCGAVTEQEALSTGLTIEDFRSRSFLKILERRKVM